MHSNRKKILLVCAVFLTFFFALPLYAESDVQSETSLNLALSSLPEAKITFTQRFIVPFLQGNNALTQGNNVKFDIKYEMTPINMSLLGNVIFTPIAFLEFSAGGMIGSGWNIELFGAEVRGMGLNRPDTDGNTSIDGSAFDGTFLGGQFGGAFQFDLAAVFPGPWNHVLIRSYHEIGCKMYSRAGQYDSWFFESDHGENQNGWRYKGSHFIGYSMPIFLNTAGILADMEKYLYNTPGGEQWGDDLARWDIGLLMNFTITENFSAALVTQFRMYRKYLNFEYGEDKLYYHNRILEDSSSRDFKFYRVALLLNYKLK